MRREYLRIAGGTKTEQGIEVLRDFWMTACAGEVTEIVGNRIRELECLGRLLCGQERFTGGDVYLSERHLAPVEADSALRDAVWPIHESPELINELTVAENFISVGSRIGPLFVQNQENLATVRAYLERFDIGIDPELPAGMLSRRQSFLLQLLKLYHNGIRAVLLDLSRYELTEDELDAVFLLMRQLQMCGMTFLVLSCKPLPTRLAIDRMVIVLNAVTVMERERVDEQALKLAETVIGDWKPEAAFAPHMVEAEPVLTIQDVWSEQLHAPQLVLHRGEVAVVSCSTSEQQQSLFALLDGSVRPDAGAIRVKGEEITGLDRTARIRRGMVCAESRLSEGFLFEKMSVLDNYAFLKGMQNRRIWWSMRHKAILKKDLERELGRGKARMRPPDLSLYEQQKLKYLSYRLFRPDILVCMNPFSSVDIETGRMTEAMIREIVQMWTGVLILTGNRWSADNAGVTQYAIDRTGVLQPVAEPAEQTEDTEDTFWF